MFILLGKFKQLYSIEEIFLLKSFVSSIFIAIAKLYNRAYNFTLFECLK